MRITVITVVTVGQKDARLPDCLTALLAPGISLLDLLLIPPFFSPSSLSIPLTSLPSSSLLPMCDPPCLTGGR